MAKTLIYKYEADDASIHPIRLSPAMAGVDGQAEPSGGITSEISAEVSGSRRRLGLHPRYVNAYKVVGTAPNDFKRYQRFYVLVKAALGVTPFIKGDGFTYEGASWTVTKTVGEQVN